MDKFAFLIHPLDMRDIIRYEPMAANKRSELIRKMVEWMPPHLASHITGIRSITGREIEGYFIVVPFLPDQFISLPQEKVCEKIINAGKIAEEKGARILGLGGFTSVVGNAGYVVANELDIPVTSGNSYTVASALEGTFYAAEKMNLDIESCNITIVGATGAIGSVCAQIIAEKVPKLTLIARNSVRLKEIAEIIRRRTTCDIKTTVNLEEGIPLSDIIITATSASGEIITSDMIKPGSLICDVALPHDVGREVAQQRPDVLVFEGGVIQVPGEVNFNYDFGYPPGISLACMAETMILTLEERFEPFSLGRRLKPEKITEIQKMADKHGFKLAGLRSFDRPVTPEQFARVKKYIQESKTIAR
ncbi:MAG: shikimate dehydrogenase [Candidatus Eremiobacteraeota bacterium]|nr:shikimate dehydrogenase [Candidatus Eremiobacteraeota bacterium]